MRARDVQLLIDTEDSRELYWIRFEYRDGRFLRVWNRCRPLARLMSRTGERFRIKLDNGRVFAVRAVQLSEFLPSGVECEGCEAITT